MFSWFLYNFFHNSINGQVKRCVSGIQMKQQLFRINIISYPGCYLRDLSNSATHLVTNCAQPATFALVYCTCDTRVPEGVTSTMGVLVPLSKWLIWSSMMMDRSSINPGVHCKVRSGVTPTMISLGWAVSMSTLPVDRTYLFRTVRLRYH